MHVIVFVLSPLCAVSFNLSFERNKCIEKFCRLSFFFLEICHKLTKFNIYYSAQTYQQYEAFY